MWQVSSVDRALGVRGIFTGGRVGSSNPFTYMCDRCQIKRTGFKPCPCQMKNEKKKKMFKVMNIQICKICIRTRLHIKSVFTVRSLKEKDVY